MTEYEEPIIRKMKTAGLVIGNLPKKTRQEFVKFAEEEFGDNYAATLKYVWDNFKMWKTFFENIDLKLNYIIDLILSKENTNKNKEEKSNNQVVMLSGRKITKKEVKKNEQ